jgi:glycosyltransferase involved in cell wall biosynthesis
MAFRHGIQAERRCGFLALEGDLPGDRAPRARGAAAPRRPLADGRRIITTGSVADVAPLVGEAAVSVAPIRADSGTRIKILAALALGVPVVSTTLGAEGLDLVPGREIVLADAPEAFAESVVRLLTDRATRDAMGRAGRGAVARAYDWTGIEARLGDEARDWLAAPG